MKKIVALVLSLAMVLGLAATAMAAPKVVVADNLGDALDSKSDAYSWTYTVVEEDKADEKDQTFATYSIEAVAKKDGAVAWWDDTITNVEKDDNEDVEITDGAFTELDGDEFVEVASADMADLFVVEGKKITYLAVADYFNEDGWAEKAVKVDLPVLPDAEADVDCCTLYAWGVAYTTFYDLDGTLYRAYRYEDTADDLYEADDVEPVVFNVDGVAVEVVEALMGNATRVDGDDLVTFTEEGLMTYLTNDDGVLADYVYSAHNYVIEGKGDSYGNGDVTKVFCDLCKTSFKFVDVPVESVAVGVFGANNYFDLTGTGLWLAIDETSGATAAPEAPEAGDKVESAETFDAGIAMYVGMSVMAAAGSAVVLKKKD